jgi:hypothetical protein
VDAVFDDIINHTSHLNELFDRNRRIFDDNVKRIKSEEEEEDRKNGCFFDCDNSFIGPAFGSVFKTYLHFLLIALIVIVVALGIIVYFKCCNVQAYRAVRSG